MSAPSSNTLSSEAAARPRPALTFRWLLFQAHLWTGLTLCVLLTLLGLTGSLLVYDHDLEEIIAPLPRATATGPGRSAGDIAAAAAQERPGFVPQSVMLPHDAGEPALVRLVALERREGGGTPQRPQVFVDPVSLQIIAVRDKPAVPLLRLAHDFHGRLLIEGGRTGRSLVGWLGVIMTGLGLSGIVLWWPRKGQWHWAFHVRRKSRGVRLHRELHGAVGIWGVIAFVIVSFTGVGIAFPESITAAVHTLTGTTASPTPRGGGGSAITVAPGEIDQVVTIAEGAVTETRLVSVTMPRAEGQAFRVTLARKTAADGAPPIVVSVKNGRVADLRDPSQLNAGDRIMAWVRPLHVGDGLGPLWRVIVFVTGLLPLLFSVTGVSMWWLKRRQRVGTVRDVP